MSVKYSLVQRANPQKRQDPKKWYAQAESTGEITSKELGKSIEEMTALTEPDVIAATTALRKAMARGLADGKIVRLGDFGSFQVTLSSEGSDSKDKFNPATIDSVKIVFRPGTELRDLLTTLKFEKI